MVGWTGSKKVGVRLLLSVPREGEKEKRRGDRGLYFNLHEGLRRRKRKKDRERDPIQSYPCHACKWDSERGGRYGRKEKKMELDGGGF